MAMQVTIAVIFLGPWILGGLGVVVGICKVIR